MDSLLAFFSIDPVFIDIMLYPFIAGIGIALISGPLGSFVVWRKMAYFGDTLAHASLLGIALGFLFDVNLYFSLLVCCLAIAFILASLQKQNIIATDTLLGILAHSALSLGIVAVTFLNIRVELMNYLFGDLLSVTPSDLVFIYIGVAVISVMLWKFWNQLVSVSINEELAGVEGVNLGLMRILLMILIGLVIAIGMKFVGALIMTSLLIIPAATARRFAKSPEQMALFASIIGVISVTCGMWLSFQYDTPAGPSVVISASFLFALSLFRKPRL